MNSKEKDFLITISIIYSIVTLITLFINYYLISLFGLNKDIFGMDIEFEFTKGEEKKNLKPSPNKNSIVKESTTSKGSSEPLSNHQASKEHINVLDIKNQTE